MVGTPPAGSLGKEGKTLRKHGGFETWFWSLESCFDLEPKPMRVGSGGSDGADSGVADTRHEDKAMV